MTITAAQREERKNYIGGSDMSVILGISKYKTAHQLYLEKKGLIENTQAESPVQYWGNQVEPILRNEFSRRNKVIVEEPSETFIHPLYPFMRANLDGYIREKNSPWEGKTSGQFMAQHWGEEQSDEIPIEYIVQIAHYCSVMSSNIGYISVLIGGNDYREFVYKRDLELERKIVEAAHNFWHSLQKGIPPPAINIKDLKLKYPQLESGKSTKINPEIRKRFYSLIDIKSQIKGLKSLEENEKFNILKYMENCEYLLDENEEVLCTHKTTKNGTRSFLIKEKNKYN